MFYRVFQHFHWFVGISRSAFVKWAVCGYRNWKGSRQAARADPGRASADLGRAKLAGSVYQPYQCITLLFAPILF